MRKLDVKQLAVRFIGGSDTPYNATYINFEDETVTFVTGGHKFGHPVTANFSEVEFFEKPKPVIVNFTVRGKFTDVFESWNSEEFPSMKRFIEECKESIDRVLYEELEHAPLDSMSIEKLENLDDVDDLLWITISNSSQLDESLWEYASNLLQEKVKAIIEDRTKDLNMYTIKVVSHNCNVEFHEDFKNEDIRRIRKHVRNMIRQDIKTERRLKATFGAHHGEMEMACSEPGIQKMIHDYYAEYRYRHNELGEE